MKDQVIKFLKASSNSSKGLQCLIGGFILCLSFSSDFSYPNINSYLTSYMRNNNTNGYNNYLTYDDFIFLTATKVLIQGLSMPFIGDLCRKLGTRWSIFIGSAIYSFGFILTYFTIKSYFSLVVLSLSLHGLGFSFVYATAISAAQGWWPRHKRGLAGSIVLSGYGFGSLIWIPAQTRWVNPDNVGAEWDPGCGGEGADISNITMDSDIMNMTMDCDNRYYRDPAMLGRVPGMFLMLGLVYAVCGLVATLLITDAAPDHSGDVGNLSHDEGGSERSLRPRQVLRTVVFYQIWLAFFSCGFSNGLMSTYSKTFGLTFINDDHFFASVAIVQNVFNGGCRIFWGYFYDKAGFKKCFLCIGLTVTVVTALLPTLPLLGDETLGAKVGYGIMVTALYAVFPGIYPIVSAAVGDAFGPVHYKANFGLLFTQSLAYVAAIITITKVPVFHSLLGYTGMFIVSGVFGIIGVMAVCCLPRQLSLTILQKNNMP